FNLTVDPKIYEGIVTQKVVIKTASAIHEIEVPKGKTILEAGLDAMIDLPYSCQIGSCLLCKAQLLSGKLKSIINSENHEYLLCCSLPLTNNIKLLVS
ncbi:MAG: 2Fe-2S iron-sulfur cluster binding domain-containing protein, partial [Sphingobacteriaceae bacterium]